MRVWTSKKFHPVDIDLTQEEWGAKMDINTERNTEKDMKGSLGEVFEWTQDWTSG